MTNYNDGKWHVWNGTSCPVNARSIVELVRRNKITGELVSYEGVAGETECSSGVGWNNNIADLPIIAFRVIKEYREPREFWVDPIVGTSRTSPDNHHHVHVREVLE